MVTRGPTIACRLCGEEFLSIRPNHLRHKHGWWKTHHPVEVYKRRYGLRTADSSVTRERRSRASIARALSRGRHWTRERIVQAIQEMRSERKPLNAAAAARMDGSLYVTARGKFGSWSSALKAAGVVDPSRVRLHRPAWTRESLRRELMRARTAGELAAGRRKSYFRTHPGILRPAMRLFGSWVQALEAVGLERIGAAPVKWTKRLVGRRIAERQKRGLSLRYAEVRKEEARLATMASRLFGRPWSELVANLGYLYPGYTRWTRRRVAQVILGLRRMREPLNAGSLEKRGHAALLGAARKLFGSWDAALRAAGVDPTRTRLRKRWSRQAIRERILELGRAGRSLMDRDLRNSGEARLVAAARTHFGKPWSKLIKEIAGRYSV